MFREHSREPYGQHQGAGGGVFPARQRVRIMIGRRQAAGTAPTRGPRARAGAPPPLHVPHFLHEAAADVPVPPSPRARAHSVACAVPVSDPDRRHRRRPRAVHGPRDWARHCQCRAAAARAPSESYGFAPARALKSGRFCCRCHRQRANLKSRHDLDCLKARCFTTPIRRRIHVSARRTQATLSTVLGLSCRSHCHIPVATRAATS